MPAWQAGHALAAATEGVQVTGAGISLLLLLPAAFVELDSDDLAALSRRSALRVAAAGVWHNAVLGCACWAGAVALAPLGGSSSGSWVVQAAVRPVQLLLGYLISLSAALALLNAAPVWRLDGQQVLEALLLPPRKPGELLEQVEQGSSSIAGHDCPASAGGAAPPGSLARRYAVTSILHTCTALYATVLVLHLLRVH